MSIFAPEAIRRSRAWGAPVLIVFAVLAVAPLVLRAGVDSYLLNLGARGLIFALAALALDYLMGQAGLVSFGHGAYLGLGAYSVAILAALGVDEIGVRLLVAIGVGALFALATGAISLRATGVYYIMSTLAFGQMLYFFAASLSAFGGDDGTTLDARGKLLGSAVLEDDRAFYAFALVLLILAYAVIDRLVGSRFGRVLAATRQNPLRAQAAGFEPFSYRLVACAISGAICAAAGVLLAEQAGFVSPAYQGWQRSGELLAMAILGGVGSLWGPIVGAVAYVILSEQLSTWTEHANMIFGPMLTLVALVGCGGLAGFFARMRRP